MNNEICKIVWAEKGKRSREVVKRSNSRVTGKHSSWKMERMIHWESTLERDAFILMDVDTSIVEFREQPAKIAYWLNSMRHDHFPDIFIVTSDGPSFVEIKEKEEALKDEVKNRTQFLSDQLYAQGYGYFVLTEQELRQGVKLSNARRLLRYGRVKPDIQTFEFVRRKYFSLGQCCLGDITINETCNNDYPVVCSMILNGLVSIDIEQPWVDQTTVYYNEQVKVL